MSEAYAAAAMALLAISGWGIANLLFDRGVPGTVSRRAAPALGGAAFLIAVLWLDASTAIAISAGLTVFALVLRLGFRRALRGVGRSSAARDWAEIAYPAAATVSLVVGWGLLGDRWLAFATIAFLSWGDSVAGLVRGVAVWSGRVMDAWRPSVAMLCVCLVVALVFQPYWVGAFGAISATAAEWFRLVAHRIWDDNWVPDDPIIVAASLAVISILAETAV